MKVERLAGAFGARISGINLAADLEGRTCALYDLPRKTVKSADPVLHPLVQRCNCPKSTRRRASACIGCNTRPEWRDA